MLEPRYGAHSHEAIERGISSHRSANGPKLGDGLAAIRYQERPALANSLEISAEPSLELTSADGHGPPHVVMVTT